MLGKIFKINFARNELSSVYNNRYCGGGAGMGGAIGFKTAFNLFSYRSGEGWGRKNFPDERVPFFIMSEKGKITFIK